MNRKYSLESRLSLLIVGLLFSLLLAIGHFQMVDQRTRLIQSMTDKYETLSRVLALMYSPIVKTNDLSLYKQFTSKFMETDRDISYIVITDSRGKVLFADTREVKKYQYRNLVGKQATRLMSYIYDLSNPDSGEPIKMSLPTALSDGERGKIIIAFGSRSLDAATEEYETNLLLTFTLALVVGIIGTILLARTVIKPIKSLINGVKKVESGNLDVTVPVTTYDEIGELTNSFNVMVTSLRESRDKLIERANTDSLTGLFNHRYFQERLRSELKRAERYNRPLSVIMVDIDNFKSLNDTHGHPVGDTVLIDVSRILTEEARREIDVITRYGGEEFAIILPEALTDEALLVAERLRQAIQRSSFIGANGNFIPVTISLGVAQYPIHSVEPEGLIMAADMALYQSKSMGRNRASLYTLDSNALDADPYKLYLLLHATEMGTIEAMAAAVDAKGQRFPGFSRAVMNCSLAIGQEIGLSEQELSDIKIGSLLHDIGKLAIPENILIKSGDLTKEEFTLIRSHPNLGYAIVQKSPHLKSMLPGILYHHEWWDGTGYPSGLKGEQIPLIARVIAISDSYNAMLCERPYSRAKTRSEAKAEILRCSGTQFDPTIVQAFLKVIEREEKSAQAA